MHALGALLFVAYDFGSFVAYDFGLYHINTFSFFEYKMGMHDFFFLTFYNNIVYIDCLGKLHLFVCTHTISLQEIA